MSEVFISYARSDRPAAQRVAKLLEGFGISVWWDGQIPIGKSFDSAIEENLHNAKCVVVLWSDASTRSEWVKNEATEGADRQILVPVLLEDVRIPLAFRRLQAADLRDWDGIGQTAETSKLLHAVKGLLGMSQAASTQVAHSTPDRRSDEQASAPPRPEPSATKPETEAATSVERTPDPRKKVMLSAKTERPRAGHDLVKRIQEILNSAGTVAALAVAPNIPSKKEQTARQSCEVPREEKVLGLIDCTIFGTAKDAVVFGESALYFHNGSAHGRLNYRDLSGREIGSGNGSINLDRGTSITLSGATDDGYAALIGARLLREIAALHSNT